MKSGEPRDLLIVRAGALGDLLLLYPAIAALLAAGLRVSLLAPEPQGHALVGPGAASGLLPLDGREVSAALADGFTDGPVARAIAGAEAVIAYTRGNALRTRLAERARRLVVHDPAPPPGGPHAARWLAEPIAAFVDGAGLEACLSGHAPPLAFTEDERLESARLTRELPQGFLAVHPGSGSPRKNWPFSRFVEAAAALSNGQPWLLVAGPAESTLASPPGAVLAREWPLRILGAALGRAGLYLGNDAGVSHLAATAGAPTLALFGPTDPALWSPVGPNATSLRAPAGDLAGLELADVAAAARRLGSAPVRSGASGLRSG
jgi:ADP-heptose:LPS heptosyltransferase